MTQYHNLQTSKTFYFIPPQPQRIQQPYSLQQFLFLMQSEPQNLRFNLGQQVDVRDSKNKWVNAEIIYMRGFEAYIHYSGSATRYDEYVDIRSDRILVQWEPGRPILVNNRIDVYHPSTGWIEGRVADLQYEGSSPSKVKIHYFNYHPKYDRWVDFSDTKSFAMIGSRSRAYGIGKTRVNNKGQSARLNELLKKILEVKVKKMVEQLQKDDYIVKNIAGDGNCLFRSVSDQLYGTEEHHREIRVLCLNYISDEKAFFQDYTTENMEAYVKRKSQDGIWGDDIEIQAISEIYGRPIEIYSTCAKPLRTFHEDNEHQIEPLRLAYVGSCHYNSIKKKSRVGRGLLELPFGEYQAIFTAAYQQKGNIYSKDMHRFRQIFSNSNALDDALTENVESSQKKEEDISESVLDFDHKQLNRALELSQNENILDQIQKSELNQIKSLIQKEQIEQELRSIQERELEIAKKLSKKIKLEQVIVRPYWFQDLLSQGFGENEIAFAIEINGEDPDRVQNFLLDNM